MRRRIFRIAVLALGGLVGLGIAVFLIARHMGSGTLQEWIGSQIQDIANAYLNPKLTFTDLAYEYPLTVSLKNLHLTADDPKNPGHTIDIIACESAEVSLSEVPEIGKPIIIQKIALKQPLISAVAIEPHSKKFVGFSGLIRGSSDTAAAADNSSPSNKKLSDVFRMRLVQIIDGKIVYDPRIPGTVPMSLDKINTLLNIEPTDEGWYKLDTDIARVPVFDLQVRGQLNLDTFSVKDVDVKILADLGQDKLDYLPPEIQALLKQYDAKGKLSIEVTGAMPVMDPLSGHVEARVNLDRANLALAGLRIPVDNFSLETRFEDRKVYLPLLRISALGGTADLSGAVDLNDRLDSVLRISIASMMPGKLFTSPLLAAAADDRLDLNLNIATSLLSLFGKAPPPQRASLAEIKLRDFRVSAPDPVTPGHNLDLVACKNLDVALSQPIISGKPVIVDQIVLNSPVLSAVSVAPGLMQFVGIPTPPTQQNAAAPATDITPSTAPSAPTPKLADTVQVKNFQLTDAKVIYDPRLPGTQRMHLDGIDASLTIDPNDPGSYKLTTDIDRSPIFKLDVNGGINIDNPGLQDLVIDLQADLSQNTLDFLPPQLQLVLKHFNAREKLDLHAAASVAMSNPLKASGQLNLHVQNIDLTQGNLNIPVQDLSLSAHVQDAKAFQTVKIAALNNVFEIHNTTSLNSRLDTDLTLDLKDVVLEPLLASLKPDQPALTTATMLNAQIELRSPLMVALGAVPGSGNEPAATATLRNLRLTTVNPIDSTPLDFFTCDSIESVLLGLPGPGKPIDIGSVEIIHPAIRAVALTPQSNQFAGFVALQSMAGGQSSSQTPSNTPATIPADASAQTKLGDIFRLHKFDLSQASIYYDPRIDTTTPLSLDQISAKINLDSLSGSAYRFEALVPSKPDLNIEVSGRADLDSMKLDPVNLDLTTRVGQNSPDYKYLPPQVQVAMRPYDPVGAVEVNVSGTVPMTKPTDANLVVKISSDGINATAGGYRLPIDQIRLPLRYTAGQAEFLDATSMGGSDITAFDGTADLKGTVMLDSDLDSTLSVKVNGMLIQDVMADKIAEPKKKDLIGAVAMDLELVDAPVMQIVADVTPPAAAPPATAPATQPDVQASASSGPPKYFSDLPASWGSCDIEVTHANLAGLELVQGIGNLAKSAFSQIIKKKDYTATIVPKETARVVCSFDKDRIDITQIHYEGEDVAADGKGYITLEQYLDLYLTGGLFQKLGGLGGVGNWIKQASDSLLYYHIYGNFQHLQFQAHTGDGKPIVEGAKKITKVAESGVKTGLEKAGEGINKAGSFLNGLFHKKKQDQPQDQSQTQPSQQN